MHVGDYKILVVDDSRNIRKLFVDILRKVGYQVFEADNGVNALKALGQEPDIHLILLDMVMPQMDGPRLLAHIRNMGNEVPVILITGITETAKIADVMQYGVTDMIVKPTTPEILCAKVSQLLHAHEPEGTFEDEGEDEGHYHLSAVLTSDEALAEELEKMAPGYVALEPAENRDTLLDNCTVAEFQTVLIDAESADKAFARVAVQLRDVQPEANLFAILHCEVGDPAEEALRNGYDGYILKPLVKTQVNRLFATEIEDIKLMTVEVFVIKLLPADAGQLLSEGYREAVINQLRAGIEKIEEDHFENVVICFDDAPHPASMLNCVLAAEQSASACSLTMGIVAPEAMAQRLRQFDQTKHIKVFESVTDAVLSFDDE